MKSMNAAGKHLRLPQRLKDLLETVEGLVEPSEAIAKSTPAEVRGVHARIGRDRAVISGQRFVESPELLQRVSLPKVRFSAGGTRLAGTDKTFQGVLRAPGFQEGLSS